MIRWCVLSYETCLNRQAASLVTLPGNGSGSSLMPEHNTRYRSLFDTTPDLVLIMDDRGIVVAANASLRRILGYAPEDVIGTPLSRLMPERYRADHQAGFGRYISTGTRKLDWTSIRLPGLRSDGYEVPLAISFGEFEEDGRKLFTGILRDVSAEKTASNRLRSEEHTSELQSRLHLVCRLLLEKKK